LGGLRDDHSDAEHFMACFSELRSRCRDRPEDLSALTAAHGEMLELCRDLNDVAQRLHASELAYAEAHTGPTSPAFIETWRVYVARFEASVLRSLLSHSEGLEALSFSTVGNLSPRGSWLAADAAATQLELQLHVMRDFARRFRLSIDEANKAVRYRVPTPDDDLRDSGLERTQAGEACVDADVAEEGQSLDPLGSFVSTVGLEPRGLWRRRVLLPFVLVPRHVSARQGASRPAAMLMNLEEAQRAFVFGAPFAALAMMRSLMETVLRDEYQIEGRDLADRINAARPILPLGCSADALHQIRMMANAALHSNPQGTFGSDLLNRIVNSGEQEFELAIVRLLGALRALIEGVIRPETR
jgi:hypothetical protein